ncbi:RNA polymerase sigma factor [Pseudohongiella nitratireducens]|uniref:RNA polymerase sigma factor n=1 Tax=Pseudohongiella nitratireducens TaxID=1768907 RepID=UPI0030ECFE7A
MPGNKSLHFTKLKDLSDISLVKRVQVLGDQGAFKALVLRHGAKVRGFLTRLSQDRDQADDLAQECFLLAYRNIQQYRPGGQFSSWLLKIAHRCYLQEQRLRSNRAEKWERFQAEAPCIESPVTQVDNRLDIEKAFSSLSEKETICLTLNYTLGYSHAEIADISGIPLGSIKTYIKAGKSKLRNALEPLQKEDGCD